MKREIAIFILGLGTGIMIFAGLVFTGNIIELAETPTSRVVVHQNNSHVYTVMGKSKDNKEITVKVAIRSDGELVDAEVVHGVRFFISKHAIADMSSLLKVLETVLVYHIGKHRNSVVTHAAIKTGW